MCVAIIMEPDSELDVEEIMKMGRANGDGVGFAWADGDAVHWLKAVSYNPHKVAELINKRKDHFRLVHFRLATAGGIKAELCHPFEIGPRAACAAAGSGSKVLIHNGHWSRWTDVFDIFRKEDVLPDAGPWSDTRFMSLCASWDLDWLDTVGGKVAVMDNEGNIQTWGSWDQLRPGVKVSNTHWQSHTYNYTRSGKDRNWLGWGWTEAQWAEWEREREDVRAKAQKTLQDEEREKEDKEGAKGDGKAGGKSGNGVGDGPEDGRLFPALGPARGDDGKYRSRGDGEGKYVQLAKGNTAKGMEDGTKRPAWLEEGKEVYDHRPWQNPANHKWYWIPWSCESSQHSRVEELTEDDARRLLVETAPASVQGGGDGKPEAGTVPG